MDSGAERTKSPVAKGPIQPGSPIVNSPALPEPIELQKGIYFQEVTLVRDSVPMKVWIYLPEKAPAIKLPCILIAPAGTPLFLGMDLGAGDRPEHLPYVLAGFAVVSYELDGHVPDFQKSTDAKLVAGAKAFKNARAGLSNARAALDYVLKNVSAIDADRIYAAGHSSAATLSLLVASDDDRIKACVAYAPCTNVPRRLGPAMLDLIRLVPGFRQFAIDCSPHTQAAKVKCPVFLFHARDDTNVPLSESQEFNDLLSKTNSQVEFVIVPDGGHYDSMLHQGVPQAIKWLNALNK
jgi:dipeptidyl aminopeptidase/acylaminoacyl peptidase